MGGVFTLTSREHPSVVTAARTRWRAARGRLAGCGMLNTSGSFHPSRPQPGLLTVDHLEFFSSIALYCYNIHCEKNSVRGM